MAKKLHYELVREFTPTTLLKYLSESKASSVEAFVNGEIISGSPIYSRVPLIWS